MVLLLEWRTMAILATESSGAGISLQAEDINDAPHKGDWGGGGRLKLDLDDNVRLFEWEALDWSEKEGEQLTGAGYLIQIDSDR